MDEPELHSHLSRIETQWSLLVQAHGETDDAHRAQCELVDRYRGPVYRYLLASLRDSGAADDLFQEFALRLLQGGFRHASPEKGRFRAYLKTALIRMVLDYRRRKSALPLEEPSLLDEVQFSSESAVWDDGWRQDLLQRAWKSLASIASTAPPTMYQVLWRRSQEPAATSGQLAESLNREIRPAAPISDVYVRKLLQRARQRFADALLDAAAELLGTDDIDRLEQELIDLHLHSYCRSALRIRRERP